MTILKGDNVEIENPNFLSFPEKSSVFNNPKGLIVFLHGYGSDGNDLITLAPLMQKHLPDYHFISPHGIEPFELALRGRQWFSLHSYDATILQPLIANASLRVQQIIKYKQHKLGLNNKNTSIVGFSQGTMLGLSLTLLQDEPFATMIGFSGLLIPPLQCKNPKTPICLIHGDEDTIIPISEMYKATEYFDKNNIKFETLSIPDLGHSIEMAGIEYAINFIQKKSKNDLL